MAKKKIDPDVRLPKIEQLPSGAYHTRVMINGESHSITAPTEEECLAEWFARKYGDKKGKKKTIVEHKTLACAVDDYIEKRDGMISPATIKAYISYRNNRFQSMMDTNIYTTTDAQWSAAVKKESKTVSPKTVLNAWSMVASAIEAATGKRPEVILPAQKKNERPYLDPDQINVFVELIKGRSIEIPALLELSSLRRSEMLAIKWTDVDFKKNVIYIRGARVVDKNGDLVHKNQNKNKSSRRVIPIIPPLQEALDKADKSSEYVVQLKGNSIYNHINRLCRENDLPEIGNHGLRHSFASLAYHLGIPEKVAMEIGGWKDSNTMHEIYTHLAQKDISKRAQDFSDYFAK